MYNSVCLRRPFPPSLHIYQNQSKISSHLVKSSSLKGLKKLGFIVPLIKCWGRIHHNSHPFSTVIRNSSLLSYLGDIYESRRNRTILVRYRAEMRNSLKRSSRPLHYRGTAHPSLGLERGTEQVSISKTPLKELKEYEGTISNLVASASRNFARVGFHENCTRDAL